MMTRMKKNLLLVFRIEKIIGRKISSGSAQLPIFKEDNNSPDDGQKFAG
jgi:hypothetical protein